MVETLAGIWLFLLSVGAGFLWGRYGGKTPTRTHPRKKQCVQAAGEFGWQELLNFLQYDGSGKLPSGSTERGNVNGETENYTGAGAGRIHRGRSV